MYNPAKELADYFAGLTDPLDSDVFSNPLDPDIVLYDGYQEFSTRGVQTTEQVVFNNSTGIPNPKWINDEWFINVMVIGKEKVNKNNCQTLINTVCDELLGKPSIKIKSIKYVHFTLTEMPRFIGFRNDVMPVYSATVKVIAQGLVDEFNRFALC